MSTDPMAQPEEEFEGEQEVPLSPPTGRLDKAWESILSRDERRTAARHVPITQTAWFGWWDGPEFQSANAVLLDISRGGAALEVERMLPPGPIWLCLEVEGRVWGTEYVVIAESRGRNLPHRARGRFLGECPDDLYRVALRGYRQGEIRTPSGRRSSQPLWDRLKHRVLGRGGSTTPQSEPDVANDLQGVRSQVVQLLAQGATEVVLATLAGLPAAERRNRPLFILPQPTAPLQGLGPLSC